MGHLRATKYLPMTLSHNQFVRGMQIINHLLALAGLAWVVDTGSWTWLAVSLAVYVPLCMLGVNIGYHRLISHRSFETAGWIERTLAVIGCLSVIGSPMAWTAVHRQHHRAAETERDPHSPYQLGPFRAWVGFWNYAILDLKLVRDLRRSEYYKALHTYYVEIILGYILVLALINPWLVVFVYAIPACLSLFTTSAVIVIAHYHGYRTYDIGRDQARNSWITHILSLGEGWHNNHHAHPYKWCQGEKWWEFDPPSWVIRLIKR